MVVFGAVDGTDKVGAKPPEPNPTENRGNAAKFTANGLRAIIPPLVGT